MAKDQVDVEVADVPHTPPTDSEKAPAAFFPWKENEQPQSSPRDVSAFPFLGFLALLGSATTVVLSWVLLFSIDGHPLFKYFKPAAWLSVILSANSVLLHVAMQEGVNVSWWYQAQKDQATAARLHETWDMGTSLVAAIRAGRKFNYIALATIFISTIPLNGLLLQNAISERPSYQSPNMTISIPALQELPLGFSANIRPKDHGVDMFGPVFSDVAEAWLNVRGYPQPWSIQLGSDTWNTSCLGSNCSASVDGVGFRSSCTNYTLPYDLVPTASNNFSIDARVLDSAVTWNASLPNEIKVNLLWKDLVGNCTGHYQVSNCTLQAAVVRYPIFVDMTSTNSTTLGNAPTLSLDPFSNHTWDHVIRDLPVLPGEGVENTTYGGIALVLATYFNGSFDISYRDDAWSSQQSGFLPVAMGPNTDGEDYCSLWFDDLDWDDGDGLQGDLTYNLFDGLRNLMFMASVNGALYLSPDAAPHNQTISAQAIVPVSRYRIRWQYWGASLAVTITIGLFILPTFYGYWRLARRTTLSPFETARAFNAPVIGDADVHTDTPRLLKAVGDRNVHRDLVVQPGSGEQQRHNEGGNGD